ncbi:MAG: cupin domain-containing protein [Burkholderiales bacterium]
MGSITRAASKTPPHRARRWRDRARDFHLPLWSRCHFKAHCHDFGEEVFVLEGVFSDEHGDYGTGSYIKSPPGSTHAPFSESGCTLFVKLRHMHPEDQGRVVVDTRSAPWQPCMITGSERA